MKILLTVHQFLPDYASGTEILTRSVARELLSRGHEVRVLTGFPARQALEEENRFDEYDLEGIHVYRFHHAYTAMGGQISKIELDYDNHLAAGYFAEILKHYQPDLVHCFHLSRLGTGLIELATRANVPTFLTPTDFWAVCPTAQLLLPDGRMCQGPNPSAGNCIKHLAQVTHQGLTATCARWLPTPLANSLVGLTRNGLLPAYPQQAEVTAISSRLGINIARYNQLAKIVAPNRFMRDLLVRHGVQPHRIVQSAFGIDDTGSESQECRSPPRQHLRVGFIGTLAHHKGCHVLIDAFKALPPGRAILKIYGDSAHFPNYADELKAQAGQNPSIEFCGVFPNPTIAQVLADLDVLVVPSLWYENTPLVLYSAQASRCPVLASNFPGISDVIEDEVNGLLFEPGDAKAMARQLVRLITEAGLAERLAANIRPPKSTADYVDELLGIWNGEEVAVTCTHHPL